MSNEQHTPETTGKPLKRLDLDSGVFEANGKTYRAEPILSIERYALYQELEKELVYGMDSKKMMKYLRELFDKLNGMQFAECSVQVYDMMKGVLQTEKREPTVLRMCALFMNTDDEDRGAINDAMITAKIDDWKKEGIAMQDFFAAASSSVNGYVELYNTIIRITSGKERPGKADSQ